MDDDCTLAPVHPVRPRHFAEHRRAETLETFPESGRRQQGRFTTSCFSINVEPVLFLVTCSVGLMFTSSSLFVYWARCFEIVSLNKKKYPDNVTYTCAQIATSNNTLQDEVEKDLASMKIWLQVCGILPALITSSLIGNWSDRNGRKIPLLFTLLGFTLTSFLQLMSTLTYESISIYYWAFSAELLMALFGGRGHSMFLTVLTIITDDCRHQLKAGSSAVPFRIGLASFVQSLGMLIGSTMVSLLIVPALTNVDEHANSYFKLTFIQFGLALTALIYAIFFVRETHFPKCGDFDYHQLVDMNEQSELSESQIKTSVFRRVQGYIGDIFGVLFARRSGWTRVCLCMTVLLVFVEFLSFDPALLLLLVKRLPFAWNDQLFSHFSVTKTISTSIGMVLGPVILTCFHWIGKDSLLIIGALAAEAGKSYLIAFATTTNDIFYSCIFGIIFGGLQPALRSFLPRMVAKEETARLLTAVNIIISFSPILSSLIFNSIFKASLTWWPGFAFFVAGIFQSFVFFGQIVIHLLMRPQWKLEMEEQDGS